MDCAYAVCDLMYMTKLVRPRQKPVLRRTFLRAWRESKGRTLEQASAAIGITHASLGRIERGKQPYSQRILEALAEYYGTDPASLLIRDPSDPDGIWSVWDHARPGERVQIVEIAKTLIKTGTH